MDADVVVVGAGAAGLAAARSLARHSLKVAVLEARDRIGGRVLSHPLSAMTTPAELGAEFIHGPAAQTRALLRELGRNAVDAGDRSWRCGEQGGLRRDDDGFSAAASQALENARALPADESAETFLRRLESDPKTHPSARAVRAFVEGFEAADPANASIRSIADELHLGADSGIARPVGGYRPMFDHLRSVCEAAGVRISLSTTVRRISWGRHDVTLDASDVRGTSQTIRASAAVITLPVGVLRHAGDDTTVSFEPALPGSKREALEGIEMGHAVKVALWFRTAFWERLANGQYRDLAFIRCPQSAFGAYWTQVPERSKLMIAWAGGPRGRALGKTSEAEVVERALNDMGAFFEEPALVREECAGTAMHDWARDPFARGVYSYVRVGGADARARLASPVGDVLFFAGEATSTDGQGGTVNGALETGERAAAQVATRLRASLD